MTDEFQSEKIAVDNERSLKKLVRAITNSQGYFALILVRCNYSHLREQMLKKLKELCPIEIREIYLEPSVKTLYTTIHVEIGDDKPSALMVYGLETVRAIDQVLSSTNQVRDEFRKNCPFPIVLWIDDIVLQKLTHSASDFKSWAAVSIKFEISTDELLTAVRQDTDTAFEKILELGTGKFLTIASLIGSHKALELESTLNDLQARNIGAIQPDLVAGIEFLIGREADISGLKEQAQQAYSKSVDFWGTRIQIENPQAEDLVRYGCLQFHLGLWWRWYATQYSIEWESACLRAKECYQRGLKAFQQSGRPDLVANFIDALGEVLTRLRQWDELESVAQTAIELHKTYFEPVRLAYVYGLRAELALSQSDWNAAKQFAELAQQTNQEPSSSDIDWSSDQQHYRNLYFLLLAQAQREINQLEQAISNLEIAQADCNPQRDPILYVRILEALQSCYFEGGHYQEAFRCKQQRQTTEQQYELRAFTGAGRLQPKRQILNPALAPSAQQAIVTQEIAASGRQQDIQRLIERINRTDHKLTIIYGQSGVGKSSIVQAGLIPALQLEMIEARDILPVLVQVYADWDRVLRRCLSDALVSVREISLSSSNDSAEEILIQLRKNADRNLLTVLIFDQFEEFFFTYKEQAKRRSFYQFLGQCLELPFVKVILSLREDYLHYLLEFNRLTRLEVINNNILDKGILYYLGNFSPEDAKTVIQTLTGKSQFHLEPSLVDELVRDLAGEIGEVRPIELQVVGAQLQTENITTLAQYQKYGPKGKLVERFLEEVVSDCGHENEHIARVVLYLLTDENGTRPLKTRAELETELEALAQTHPEHLDVVLEIFVKSGLVFLVPEIPADRYQLVHDYLVSFIRQQQSAELTEELKKEREQRQRSEAELNRVLKRQLKIALGAGVVMAALAILAAVFGVDATKRATNAQLRELSAASNSFFDSNQELDAIIQSLKAGVGQRHSFGVTSDSQIRVLTALQEAVYATGERNRLEGHTDTVTITAFSPDGRIIASGSKDKTVILWQRDGHQLHTLKGHTGIINQISFSPDNQMLASASGDATVRLWSLDGTALRTVSGNQGKVLDVRFSPNGQILASAGSNGTVKLWTLDGKELATLRGHSSDITNVVFSPDGQMIATASTDDTVRLWNIEGRELKSIESSGIVALNFTPMGKALITISGDNTARFWGRDGTLKGVSYNISYNPISFVSFSPDGKTFMLSDGANPAQIWTVEEGKLTRKSRTYQLRNVNSASLSPDSQIVATTSKDNTITLRSLDKDRLKLNEGSRDGSQVEDFCSDRYLLSIEHESLVSGTILKLWNLDDKSAETIELSNNIDNVICSSDGQAFAAATVDSTTTLWNRTGSLLRTFDENPLFQNFSPDGQLLVIVGRDNTATLWSRYGQRIQTIADYGDRITQIVFSPDSQTFALVSRDHTITLWNRDGQLTETLQGHRDRITQVVFSPNSQVLASVSLDNTIKLWRRNGDLIQTIEEYNNEQTELLFSPDSQRLVLFDGGYRYAAKLFDLDGRLMRVLSGHESSSSGVSFSGDSRTIAVATDDGVQLWSRDGILIQTLAESGDIQQVVFSPDDELIAMSRYGGAQLWSKDGRLIQSLTGYSTSDSIDLRFSADSQTLISRDRFGRSVDSSLRLWNRDGILLREIKRDSADEETQDSNKPSPGIVISPNGQLIASVKVDHTIELWSSTGTLIKTLQGHGDAITALSFSLDSQMLASVSEDNVIKLWNSNGELIQTLESKGKRIEQVSFNADGTALLVVDGVDVVKVWNRAGTEIANLAGHTDRINGISFSPSGQQIASASDDNTIRLWSLDRSKSLILEGHEDQINSVSFSPDGQRLISASDDNKVKIWSIGGKELESLEEHSDQVNSVSFSPDGAMIASASDDSTIHLWKGDGEAIRTLKGHSDAVTSIRFSRDSQMLISTGDSNVIFWTRDGILIRRSGWNVLRGRNLSLSPDGQTLLVDSGYYSPETSVVLWSLNLNTLLELGCNRVRDYLTTNPNVEESDRHLCDGIGNP